MTPSWFDVSAKLTPRTVNPSGGQTPTFSIFRKAGTSTPRSFCDHVRFLQIGVFHWFVLAGENKMPHNEIVRPGAHSSGKVTSNSQVVDDKAVVSTLDLLSPCTTVEHPGEFCELLPSLRSGRARPPLRSGQARHGWAAPGKCNQLLFCLHRPNQATWSIL